MKVYTTKYALTRGIEIKEVTGSDVDDEYVYSVETYRQQFRLGRDAFPTYEEAAIAARKMRDKKVVSLLKQLTKMRELLFTTREPAAMRSPAEED